jgi:hypothetical protein
VRLYRNTCSTYRDHRQKDRRWPGAFKTIELDFQVLIRSARQLPMRYSGSAGRHPESRIVPRTMNENVEFMGRRAGWVDDLLTTMDLG